PPVVREQEALSRHLGAPHCDWLRAVPEDEHTPSALSFHRSDLLQHEQAPEPVVALLPQLAWLDHVTFSHRPNVPLSTSANARCAHSLSRTLPWLRPPSETNLPSPSSTYMNGQSGSYTTRT